MDWIKEKVNNKDYKGFVGKAKNYDTIGKMVFDRLIENGLSKRDYVLDYGCGSLRAGKYLIPYLYKGRYTGYEPNYWLVKEALNNEIDNDVLDKKEPKLYSNILDVYGEYTFIFAHSVFVHASMNDIKNILNDVKERLAKGGIFIFNFIEGKDNTKEEWSYPQGVTYTKETIFNILKEYDFNFEEVEGNKHIWIKATL